MKTMMKTKYFLTVILCLGIAGIATARPYRETIKKEIPFPGGDNAVLILENIFGNMEVEGYSGDQVILEINEEYNPDSDEELAEIKRKAYITFDTYGDTVDVFVDGVCGCSRPGKNRNSRWEKCDYDYRFDFKVKVPSRANIKVSTVNEGDVKISGITGEVVARNVNGGIFVDGISGPADVHTINSDVEVKYTKNPNKHSKYYSLNGDVNVYYYPNLSADLHFKSFQGDLYTNFDISEKLPPVKLETTAKNRKGTTYRIEDRTAVRIGQGGVQLDFETFNGDVFVRKI